MISRFSLIFIIGAAAFQSHAEVTCAAYCVSVKYNVEAAAAPDTRTLNQRLGGVESGPADRNKVVSIDFFPEGLISVNAASIEEGLNALNEACATRSVLKTLPSSSIDKLTSFSSLFDVCR